MHIFKHTTQPHVFVSNKIFTLNVVKYDFVFLTTLCAIYELLKYLTILFIFRFFYLFVVSLYLVCIFSVFITAVKQQITVCVSKFTAT